MYHSCMLSCNQQKPKKKKKRECKIDPAVFQSNNQRTSPSLTFKYKTSASFCLLEDEEQTQPPISILLFLLQLLYQPLTDTNICANMDNLFISFENQKPTQTFTIFDWHSAFSKWSTTRSCDSLHHPQRLFSKPWKSFCHCLSMFETKFQSPYSSIKLI